MTRKKIKKIFFKFAPKDLLAETPIFHPIDAEENNPGKRHIDSFDVLQFLFQSAKNCMWMYPERDYGQTVLGNHCCLFG